MNVSDLTSRLYQMEKDSHGYLPVVFGFANRLAVITDLEIVDTNNHGPLVVMRSVPSIRDAASSAPIGFVEVMDGNLRFVAPHGGRVSYTNGENTFEKARSRVIIYPPVI